ncbi:hypothetical protein LJK87_18435 [Paenibacillus sp. P25]|nr:hypothetical protein LJK87_18435 [Paenibacillus sp. P25]
MKHVFILGVNDGNMPALISENGVLTEQERESLESAGLRVAEGSRRRSLDESFLIYCSFCTPSEGLWLSYPLADEEGKTLLAIRRAASDQADVSDAEGTSAVERSGAVGRFDGADGLCCPCGQSLVAPRRSTQAVDERRADECGMVVRL